MDYDVIVVDMKKGPMHQQTSPYRFTLGHHLWVVMMIALGLTLGTQAAAAKECHREMPLPADVRLSVPGPEVPEAVARFAGTWLGAWLDEGSEALCHTLIVEEVLANGYPRVIYSIGTYTGGNIRVPQFWRVTGRIVDGVLRFHLPEPGRPELAYQFAGETLQGTFKGEGGARLTRVADVSQVGCGPQAGGLPPSPPAVGPRDRLTAAELRAADLGTGLVHNAYFMPVGPAAPAVHAFKGTVMVQTATLVRRYQGCTVLHAAKLAEAVYKTAVMGLPTVGQNRYGEARYHLSFWSAPYRTANGCFFQIPYMAGYGGNLVVLLPNGISACRIADGDNSDLVALVLEAEAVRPFPCPAGLGEELRPLRMR